MIFHLLGVQEAAGVSGSTIQQKETQLVSQKQTSPLVVHDLPSVLPYLLTLAQIFQVLAMRSSVTGVDMPQVMQEMWVIAPANIRQVFEDKSAEEVQRYQEERRKRDSTRTQAVGRVGGVRKVISKRKPSASSLHGATAAAASGGVVAQGRCFDGTAVAVAQRQGQARGSSPAAVPAKHRQLGNSCAPPPGCEDVYSSGAAAVCVSGAEEAEMMAQLLASDDEGDAICLMSLLQGEEIKGQVQGRMGVAAAPAPATDAAAVIAGTVSRAAAAAEREAEGEARLIELQHSGGYSSNMQWLQFGGNAEEELCNWESLLMQGPGEGKEAQWGQVQGQEVVPPAAFDTEGDWDVLTSMFREEESDADLTRELLQTLEEKWA